MSIENTYGTWPDYQCSHCGAQDALEETADGGIVCHFCGIEE